MLGIDAWVSLFGPAYFAYAGVTVPFMVAWAIACGVLAAWNNRASRRQGQSGPRRHRLPFLACQYRDFCAGRSLLCCRSFGRLSAGPAFRENVAVRLAELTGRQQHFPARRSKHTFDVGLGKVASDIQQTASVLLRHFIGKAIAEIECGQVDALAPLRISLGDAPG